VLQKIGAGRNLESRGEARKVIHAELAWDDHATACGIAAHSSSPVLKLCRLLVDAGHDPGSPLEAWRNGTLCLRVRSIGEAAGLTVKSAGNGAPLFVRIGEGATAPPIDLTTPDHAEVPDAWSIDAKGREAP
jgi:hypothetical protein